MPNQRQPYQDRVIRDLLGKPIIKGTRIGVEHILDFLAEELDVDGLLKAYPSLTTEDVKASIAFAGASIGAKSSKTLAEQGITLEELLAPGSVEHGVSLRDYNPEEITTFIQDDQLSSEARAVIKRFGRRAVR